MSWQAEHGKQYDIPDIIELLVKKKIVDDMSWHNDASPSFGILDPKREDYGVRLWVDHPLESMRENFGKRFIVQEGDFTGESDFEVETDDLEEALVAFLDRVQKYRPDMDEPWQVIEDLDRELRRA